ncbi:hypothetical protein C8R43DRAFT_1240396 [Mycena crocata]|nr:hypothetical protein C8R43DRAFT_1240396 [Mycena crocata]
MYKRNAGQMDEDLIILPPSRFTSGACASFSLLLDTSLLLAACTSIHTTNMHFISALFVASALVLISSAAPVAEIPSVLEAREATASRTPTDVFTEVDLNARAIPGPAKPEAPPLRDPGSGGCVVA